MKIKSTLTVLLAALLSMLNTSCDDYLDVDPKGLTVLETIQDYDLLLNGTWRSMFYTTDTDILELTSDNHTSTELDLRPIDDPLNDAAKAYKFDSDIFLSHDENVRLWDAAYGNIYTYNTVINNVGSSKIVSGYSEEDKESIIAEARVGRAFEYWLLVNTFGKQYNEATTSTDLGVPLILEDNVSGSVPARSTVKEIYDFIISENLEALPNLPNRPKNYTREYTGSAYAYLARYYLFMSNFEKAFEFADKAIDVKGEISDFTTVPVTTSDYFALEDHHFSDQYTFMSSQGTPNWFYRYGILSEEMTNLLSSSDTRFSLLYSDCAWQYDDQTGWNYNCGLPPTRIGATLGSVTITPTVPEMYLTRAECNARLSSGTIGEVINDLNSVRENRIYDYTPLSVADFTSKAEALAFVLDERRRETLYMGTRFFDLRRLNLEPEFAKTIVHELDGTTYTLAPNSDNWAFPIPASTLNFNPHLEQNPRE
ncbi:RagB/SusD family nutrient uptake outer membrane protein [uncultured Wocania sp.]|uniref:RagB/SusD family nutrient uptake outer membrane protein n=1 Tax=uncultured Wocania sp. TaxID=2834404 RepID=UPI0030FB5392